MVKFIRLQDRRINIDQIKSYSYDKEHFGLKLQKIILSIRSSIFQS